MDSTLFVARAQDQFSEGHTIYFWVRGAPIVTLTSHPWRTHLPSIRYALLHQRYAISAAHVRLPLLALIHPSAWKWDSAKLASAARGICSCTRYPGEDAQHKPQEVESVW